MLTPFGKASRKLRIDNGMRLKDLADQLAVTSSYLSAIETGKRALSKDMLDRIVSILAQTQENAQLLKKAAAESAEIVKIKLTAKSENAKDFAIAFARQFEELSDADINKFRELLNGGGNE